MIIACKCKHLMEVKEVLEEVFYAPETKYPLWYEMYNKPYNIIIYVNLEKWCGEPRYGWDYYSAYILKKIGLDYPEEIFLDITDI